jgi:predicted transcriptional regulator
MKNPQTFKLIEGSYSSKESREILQNVFSSKIQFHQMKNFSSQERFGKDDITALKRIPELKESIDKILRMS